ncbi:transcription factor CP2 isoform X1 [Schistocerca americana]|uniref:transcription factor CP2 isoform X1 n=1 Tax=Schistocerca americana TaxID=7009 RepID=UPI001F4FE3C9|nr:transcription factor CP2 isoform X1 [Schistocerca americana]XP_046985369.1 transcription factor CP2 isoform X1 [Schistocerca americana]XP_046985370.1 transcription factor CP2 isoform X1 [Schistocerca americana]
MELQMILRDVIKIMDLPFADECAAVEDTGELTEASPAGVLAAQDGLSVDSVDLLPWTNDVRLVTLGPPKKKRRAADDEGRTAAKKILTEPGTGGGEKMSSWQVEDIDDNLAADLDGSLSGLGVDLTTGSYSMSEALLTLPSLAVCKQEAPSPSGPHNESGIQENTQALRNDGENIGGGTANSQLHQLLQQHGAPAALYTGSPNRMDTTAVSHANINHNEAFQCANSQSSTTSTLVGAAQDLNIDCRFQYVLAAATSIATKVNEETLTYLNQGQSYEIKLKKLGELSAYRGKILKSVIRICFHERRLQYMEREQMAAWQASRPGDRIVEVDIPLSYGIFKVEQDSTLCNTVEFLWDPTKEVGVYIKVNCISTEFTPKKHGGEKGVPFRIQVETYLHNEGKLKWLHAAACQIKVFKLKGADRKHKQDREKILKRPPAEQEKFQPSYECTVLNDIPSDLIMHTSMSPIVGGSTTSVYSPPDNHGNSGHTVGTSNGSNVPSTSVAAKEERSSQPLNTIPPVPVINTVLPDQGAIPTDVPVYQEPLASEATAQQAAQWLQANRFGSYLHTFANFSGADILRLSRNDLIQICGVPDGIRLFNALHSKSIAPCLTVYLCVGQNTVYHALYLDNFSCGEMAQKLATMLGVSGDQIHDLYMQGPNGIHIQVTDEVIRNLKDEALFNIEILHDQNGARYRLLLKPSQSQ